MCKLTVYFLLSERLTARLLNNKTHYPFNVVTVVNIYSPLLKTLNIFIFLSDLIENSYTS